jgi:hypothetical protein
MDKPGSDCRRERRISCCDVTVATLGLIVVLGSVFRAEITWLLQGA